MYTHVVLLRGVNVGKAKRVPMAAFKKLLHKLGCSEVVTILNSGNAVVSMPELSSATLAASVSDALHATLGFEISVVVKSMRDFHNIVRDNHLIFRSMNHSRLLVIFARTSAELRALRSLANVASPPDQFLLGRKAAYLYCPDGLLESEAAKVLLGKAGSAVTTRNWATVLKLHALSTGRAA